jgi:Na+-transporting NADH:ubiquinone oxidoreductase subunit NqrD
VLLVVVLRTHMLGRSFEMCGDVAVSTRDPPCEQWLAGLGAGAGFPFVAWCLFVLQPFPPSPSLTIIMPWCGDVAISTCDPPCKQWLAGLGAGAGFLFVAWHLFMLQPSPHHRHAVE